MAEDTLEVVLRACQVPRIPGVSVGVQQGSEVVDVARATGEDLEWRLRLRLNPEGFPRGPYVHGRSSQRFLYLTWLGPDGAGFRRAKLMLDILDERDLRRAAAGAGLLAQVGLTMRDGTPLCAAVRPPAITWSVLEPGSTASPT